MNKKTDQGERVEWMRVSEALCQLMEESESDSKVDLWTALYCVVSYPDTWPDEDGIDRDTCREECAKEIGKWVEERIIKREFSILSTFMRKMDEVWRKVVNVSAEERPHAAMDRMMGDYPKTKKDEVLFELMKLMVEGAGNGDWSIPTRSAIYSRLGTCASERTIREVLSEIRKLSSVRFC